MRLYICIKEARLFKAETIQPNFPHRRQSAARCRGESDFSPPFHGLSTGYSPQSPHISTAFCGYAQKESGGQHEKPGGFPTRFSTFHTHLYTPRWTAFDSSLFLPMFITKIPQAKRRKKPAAATKKTVFPIFHRFYYYGENRTIVFLFILRFSPFQPRAVSREFLCFIVCRFRLFQNRPAGKIFTERISIL